MSRLPLPFSSTAAAPWIGDGSCIHSRTSNAPRDQVALVLEVRRASVSAAASDCVLRISKSKAECGTWERFFETFTREKYPALKEIQLLYREGIWPTNE